MTHQIAANSSSKNVSFTLIVESGSAEAAEGPNGTVGLLMFYHNTESICAYIGKEPEFSWSRNSSFEIREGKNVGTRQFV